MDQFWPSRQRFLKMRSEGSYDWFGLSPKYSQPPGNFSVIPDENPMSCDVLMFNLGLYLNIDLSDKQHPKYWNLTLSSSIFAVFRRSNSALPWTCQYLFIEFACFGWSQAKPRDPNQVQCPILMDIVVRGYTNWNFYNLCERWKRHRDFLSSYGKPVAGSTRFCVQWYLKCASFTPLLIQFNFSLV